MLLLLVSHALFPLVPLNAHISTVMGLAEKLAGTFAAASIIWFSNWQMPYLAIGLLSLFAAILTPRMLVVTGHTGVGKADSKSTGGDDKKKMTLGQIVRRITRIPAFLCLVGQGIFGGIPWDMMSFLLLLYEWRGLSREQIVSIQFSKGISGDRFAHLPRGRIYVALTSKALGTTAYGMFLFSTTYKSIFFWVNVFFVIAGWPRAGVLRPMTAEMARNPSERAQIVSLWLLLEMVSLVTYMLPCSQSQLNDTAGHMHIYMQYL